MVKQPSVKRYGYVNIKSEIIADIEKIIESHPELHFSTTPQFIEWCILNNEDYGKYAKSKNHQ